MNYKEVQKMNQWWLKLLLYSLCVLALYTFIMQIVFNKPVGDNSLPNIGVYVFLVFSFGMLYLFSRIQLVTQINEVGIKIHYKPFVSKHYNWNEVRSAVIVNYGFVGFGIRYGRKYGTIYNVSGNYGISLILKNGSKVLIGTQNGNEIREIIEKCL